MYMPPHSPAAKHHRALVGTHCAFPLRDDQAELTCLSYWLSSYTHDCSWVIPCPGITMRTLQSGRLQPDHCSRLWKVQDAVELHLTPYSTTFADRNPQSAHLWSGFDLCEHRDWVGGYWSVVSQLGTTVINWPCLAPFPLAIASQFPVSVLSPISRRFHRPIMSPSIRLHQQSRVRAIWDAAASSDVSVP